MFVYEEVTTPGQAGRYFLARSAWLDLLLHRVEVSVSPSNPNPYRSLSCTYLSPCCIQEEQYFYCKEKHRVEPRSGFVRGRSHASHSRFQTLLAKWLDFTGVGVLEAELLAGEMADAIRRWDCAVVEPAPDADYESDDE